MKTMKTFAAVAIAACPASAGAGNCTMEHDVDYNGHDIVPLAKRLTVDTADQCCQICRATAGCLFWSWNSAGNRQCCPKTSDTGRKIISGITSGSLHIAPPAAPTPTPPNFPWFDPNVSISNRVEMLVGNMTLDEKIHNMVVNTPGVPRLAVPTYHWRNNVLHGLVDNGVSTMFPQVLPAQTTGITSNFPCLPVSSPPTARAPRANTRTFAGDGHGGNL